MARTARTHAETRGCAGEETEDESWEQPEEGAAESEEEFGEEQLDRGARRAPGASKRVLQKGGWTEDEDSRLFGLVGTHGERKWSNVATLLGGRIGKQCRERWNNHLAPGINRGEWSDAEELLLIDAHRELGNRWAGIAAHLPGRTENSVKNHWNATLRRKEPSVSSGRASTSLRDYIVALGTLSGATKRSAPPRGPRMPKRAAVSGETASAEEGEGEQEQEEEEASLAASRPHRACRTAAAAAVAAAAASDAASDDLIPMTPFDATTCAVMPFAAETLWTGAGGGGLWAPPPDSTTHHTTLPAHSNNHNAGSAQALWSDADLEVMLRHDLLLGDPFDVMAGLPDHPTPAPVRAAPPPRLPQRDAVPTASADRAGQPATPVAEGSCRSQDSRPSSPSAPTDDASGVNPGGGACSAASLGGCERGGGSGERGWAAVTSQAPLLLPAEDYEWAAQMAEAMGLLDAPVEMGQAASAGAGAGAWADVVAPHRSYQTLQTALGGCAEPLPPAAWAPELAPGDLLVVSSEALDPAALVQAATQGLSGGGWETATYTSLPAAGARATAQLPAGHEAPLRRAVADVRGKWPDTERVVAALRTGPAGPGDVLLVLAVTSRSWPKSIAAVTFAVEQLKASAPELKLQAATKTAPTRLKA